MGEILERPILFSGKMIQAILSGRKTQTRRLLLWEPLEPGLNLTFSGLSVGECSTGHPRSGYVLQSRAGGCWQDRTKPVRSKYGYPGDRLWVCETWYCDHAFAGDHVATCVGCVRCSHSDEDRIAEWRQELYYRADGEPEMEGERVTWYPSIHMPRWASRITLEVMEIRIERLNEIGEKDAVAEGFGEERGAVGQQVRPGPRDRFAELWDKINGKRAAWESNPWVWVVSFRRLTP